MSTTRPTKGFLPTLVTAFSFAVLAVLATTAVGLQVVHSLRSDLFGAVDHAHRLARVHELRFELERVVSTSRGYLLSANRERQERAQSALNQAREALDAFDKPEGAPRRGPLIDKVRRAAEGYLNAIDEALRTAPSGASAAQLFRDELDPKREALESALQKLVEAEDSHAALQFLESEETASRYAALLLALGCLAFILTAGAASFFGRGLFRSFRAEGDALRRAEQAVAARDDLLAIIAHDLRSPLTAIMLKATLIRQQTEANHDDRGEKVAKQAAAIESTATRMEFLIQSLLDAATIEAGRFSLATEPCDVDSILKSAFEIFEPLAGRKSLRLELSTQQDDGLTVRAERERVIQVLSNLLANAVKFTPEGGTITVGADAVGNDVRFDVTDTGQGIAPEHLPHLFSRYWKAEKGGRRGAGLGLYIAKGIVEAHSGRLWVESTPGKGSTFHFTLPSTERPAQKPSPTPIQPRA